MMAAYGAGAVLIAIMGQDSGAALLDQALAQDLSMEGILGSAERMTGIGVNATEAAVIVAAAGIIYKLLQMLTPFTEAGAAWFRRKLLGHDDEAPPPGRNRPGAE